MTIRLKKTLYLFLVFVLFLNVFAFKVSASIVSDEFGLKVTLGYKPGSIIMDSEGSVFAGDWSNGNLYKYKPDGNLDSSWGNNGNALWAESKAEGTCGMCFSQDGNIIITGQRTNKVFLINKDTGALIKTISQFGPLGCSTDEAGNIYIAGKGGMYKYDSDLNLLNSSSDIHSYGVAVIPNGKIYYSDSGLSIYRLNSDLTTDTAFGDNGKINVFNNYTDGVFFYDNKIYTCSEGDYKIVQMDLDGSNITTVIEGTGPNNVFITNDKYVVPFWGGRYFQTFTRPKINIVEDNFKCQLNTLSLLQGSTQSVELSITSDSTEQYSVTAKAYNKVTGKELTATAATGATLVNGDASVILKSPPGGWQAGEYIFKLILTTSVGSIHVSDSMVISQTLKVSKPITIALTTDKSNPVLGDTIGLTAALSNADNPTGTVTFKNGSSIIGSASVVENTAILDYLTTKVGTLSLNAEYSGDSNNASAASSAVLLAVTKPDQTGFVFGDVPTTKIYGDSNFTVSATGGQGSGEVTYSSGNPSVLSVNPTTGAVTIEGIGTAKIIAVKAEDSNYNEVSIETNTITVSKPDQTGFVFGDVPTTKIYGDSNFTVSATGGQGSGEVTYSSGNPSVLSVNPTTGAVTIEGIGTAKIIAVKAEDSNYNEAVAYTHDITVNKAILIAKANSKSINYGQKPNFSVTVTGFVNGESPDNLSGYEAPIADCRIASIGKHNISIKGGNATANYQFSYQKGILTINEVTVTSNDYIIDGNTAEWNSNNVTITPKGDYTKIWNGITWDDKLTITEGTANPVIFKLKKADGTKTSIVTIDNVKVDTTAPNVPTVQYNYTNISDKTIDDVSYNHFFRETVNLDIAASDGTSGVKTVEYQILPKGGKVNCAEWQVFDSYNKPSLSGNQTGFLAVRATDNAGNISDISYYDGFTLDNSIPTIKGIQADGDCYIVPRIIINDDYGTFCKSVYTCDGGVETSFENGDVFTIPGNYTVTVMDQSDNKSTVNFTIKPFPTVYDLDATAKSEKLVSDIRKEYDIVKDKLSESYKTKINDLIVALENKIKKLHKKTVNDLDEGASAEGIDNTDFNPNTELIVKKITSDLSNAQLKTYNNNIKIVSKDKELVELYDVKLLLNNRSIQPDGKIKIKLKLTEKQKKYTDLQVVYLDDEGNAQIVESEIQGDYIVFYTTHFSYYGIIGTSSATISICPSTGDRFPIAEIVFSGIIFFVIVLLYKKNRKLKIGSEKQ